MASDDVRERLDKKLKRRPSITEVKDRGVLPKKSIDSKLRALEREMAKDTLSGLLADRPEVAELVDSGLMASSAAEEILGPEGAAAVAMAHGDAAVDEPAEDGEDDSGKKKKKRKGIFRLSSRLREQRQRKKEAKKARRLAEAEAAAAAGAIEVPDEPPPPPPPAAAAKGVARTGKRASIVELSSARTESMPELKHSSLSRPTIQRKKRRPKSLKRKLSLRKVDDDAAAPKLATALAPAEPSASPGAAVRREDGAEEEEQAEGQAEEQKQQEKKSTPPKKKSSSRSSRIKAAVAARKKKTKQPAAAAVEETAEEEDGGEEDDADGGEGEGEEEKKSDDAEETRVLPGEVSAGTAAAAAAAADELQRKAAADELWREKTTAAIDELRADRDAARLRARMLEEQVTLLQDTLNRLLDATGNRRLEDVQPLPSWAVETYVSVADAREDNELYHSGWIYKEGSTMRSWKRRYMVLRGAMLRYYSSEADERRGKKPLGVVNLDSAVLHPFGEHERVKYPCMELVTFAPTKRKLHFYAEDAEQNAVWWERICMRSTEQDYLRKADAMAGMGGGEEGAVVVSRLLLLARCPSEYAMPSQRIMRELDLSGIALTVEAVQCLGGLLRSHVYLHTLLLRDCKLEPLSFSSLADALGDNGSVTKLSLAGNALTAEGAGLLAVALGDNVILESLDLTATAIGDSGAKALAPVCAAHASLRSLTMADCQLTTRGAVPLLRALARQRSCALRELSLAGNALEAGCSAIAELIDGRNALRSLDVSNNAFAEDALTALVAVVRGHRNLATLLLHENKVDEETERALITMASRNRSLTRLTFSSHDMDGSALTALRMIAALRV